MPTNYWKWSSTCDWEKPGVWLTLSFLMYGVMQSASHVQQECEKQTWAIDKGLARNRTIGWLHRDSGCPVPSLDATGVQ